MNDHDTIQNEVRIWRQVEENYPRLLEQVTAIEQLGSAHSHFQHEMDAVAKRADSLAIHMAEQVKIRATSLGNPDTPGHL